MLKCSKGFAERHSASALDVLINCASVVPETRQESPDGLEMQFAVNVYAYFVLIKSFVPLLLASKREGGGRIVNVASNYAGNFDMSDLQFTRRAYDPNLVYQQTKAADRILSSAASKQYKTLQVHACHPGVVSSALLTGLGMAAGWESAAEGAKTPVFLATVPAASLGASGQFWDQQKPKREPLAGKGLEQPLWSYCEEVLQRAQAVASAEGKEGESKSEV